MPVTRVEGIGWTLLSRGQPCPAARSIGGQGGAVRLDGSLDAVGPRALFVTLGGEVANLSGSSRAAQWMLLDQLIDEVRGRIAADSQFALLTPAGRTTLAKYFGGGGASWSASSARPTSAVLRWAKARERAHRPGRGGAKPGRSHRNSPPPTCRCSWTRWPTCRRASTNSARPWRTPRACMRAGVEVSFFQTGDASHNARKIRQLAGNAVANGLPWEAGTGRPDLGAGERARRRRGIGTHRGRPACRPGAVERRSAGRGQHRPARSGWTAARSRCVQRQTELRDRYLRTVTPADAGGLPRAYPESAR